MTVFEELSKNMIKIQAEAGYPDCGEYDGGFCNGYSQAVYDAGKHSDWTPVSNPPKETDWYLVTVLYNGRKQTVLDLYTGEWAPHMGEIIAWMPKPEPYKGE